MVLKIGLTGASGMLGRHVLEDLAGRGVLCRATSRSAPPYLPSIVEWTPFDLTRIDPAGDVFDRLLGDVKAVIHAAAALPGQGVTDDAIIRVNVQATRALGDWARRRGTQIVLVSGATVYAEPDRPGLLESDAKVSGPALGGLYGLSKYLAELVLKHEESLGLRLTVLRPTSIYGVGLPNSKLVHSMWMKAVAGEDLEIDEPVDDSFNLVHASDVALMAIRASTEGITGTFNIAGDNVSLMELAQLCSNLANGNRVRVSKGKLGRPAIRRFDLDDRLARSKLGYDRRVNLASYYRWLMRHGGHPESIVRVGGAGPGSI